MADTVVQLAEQNPFSPKPQDPKDLTPEEIKAQEAQAEMQRLCKEFLEKIATVNTPYTERLEGAVQLSTTMLPMLLNEISSPAPNIDRSIVASRASNIIKDVVATIVKKHDAQVSEDMDPNSPKVQMIFAWFLQLLKKVCKDINLDELTQDNLFQAFAQDLLGWEEKVIKSMKGISAKALNTVSNPFLERFKEMQKEAALEAKGLSQES